MDGCVWRVALVSRICCEARALWRGALVSRIAVVRGALLHSWRAKTVHFLYLMIPL
jgi:hypothetical protein